MIQGASTIAWWPWISSSPSLQRLFFAPGTADAVLSKFAAPDILVFGVGSIITAGIAMLAPRTAKYAAWLVVGAAAYACVGAWSVNWPMLSVPLADFLMLGTLASSAFCAVRLSKRYA